MDAEDLQLFARSLADATSRFGGAELDEALGELGWFDALDVEPRAAISTLFELQGRDANVSSGTSRALSTVLSMALDRPAGPSVILPSLNSWRPPGNGTGDGVTVNGLLLGQLHEIATVVASIGADVVAVDVPVASLTTEAIGGLDPRLGLTRARGTIASPAPTPVPWKRAVRMARLALAQELIGCSRAMLDLARTHALERVQFDRPIAGFQAVRHRLAETFVAIESAATMVDEAWEDDAEVTAVLAKALAGRAARTTARHCQQVLAGIGFTLEHPFHFFLKRALTLDELFGSTRSLTLELGRASIASRQLPPARPL